MSGRPALARPGEFTNYAVGRARARANAPAFASFDLSSQVGLFLTDFRGHARPDAIYVIWIGANDLDDALQALATDPTGATSATIAQTAIETVAANIEALYAAGARTFLIPDLPDLGETPAVRALGPAAAGAAAQLTGLYNQGLQQALAQLQVLPQVRFIQFDVDGLLQRVIAEPTAYRARRRRRCVPHVLHHRRSDLRAPETAPVLGRHPSDGCGSRNPRTRGPAAARARATGRWRSIPGSSPVPRGPRGRR